MEPSGSGEHGTEIPVPGVSSMDHTADVGLEVEADDPAELFRRAAAGMMYLILERLPERAERNRELRVTSADLAGLFRDWLRELLFWHEAEGFTAASAEIRTLDAGDGGEAELEATVRGGSGTEAPVREIKGVTLHGLAVERRDGGWYGRVIFDV